MDHFERWVHATKFRIMRPNIMNQYGAVLDDFGLEAMLDRLMSDFIRPLSRGYFLFFLMRMDYKNMSEMKKLLLIMWTNFCNLMFFVVFYSEIGGSSLDSHHGFVVEYGINRDVELGRFLKFRSLLCVYAIAWDL